MFLLGSNGLASSKPLTQYYIGWLQSMAYLIYTAGYVAARDFC